ncbi:hypothetical protein [Humibacter ginsenosidimutans]|uniref:Uncharacterized protein n=1 Tax=Humibacter ginsenosidimutans TaxID=2599293 RepID=A0A5B8M468_9MICO|nr:hypothetical protein [Humibacter ginsenosidimutans]QDZ14759.1 hypothetical protein FPZ11_08310 [Humibacter ginsenosidimutans]
MTIALHLVSAVVGDIALDVKAGSVTLDEAWAPYAKSDLTIALPNAATLTALDPRGDARVTISAARSTLSGGAFVAQSSRTFNLSVRSLSIDHNEDTVELTLASDEALLQSYGLISTTPDTSALAHQTSVRSIVNEVLLAKIGASLAAGDADADFTTTTALTNMMTDPATTFITSLQGYAAVNCTVDKADTSWFVAGTHSGNLYNPTTADSYLKLDPNTAALQNGVQAGKTYTLSGWGNVKVKCTGTSQGARERTITIFVTAASLGGTVEYHSAQLPNTVNTPTQVGVTFTVPADATAVIGRAYLGNTIGQVRWNAFLLVEGDGLETDGVTPLAYWDGASAATAFYTYTWTGNANASTSTRTPLVSRDPSALTWQPGDDAWDFIGPVLTQAHLRLFCDEQRVWRLVDNTYSLDGRVTVATGFNAYSASDTISLDAVASDGTPLWCDAVVVKYTWTDSTGAQQTAYDAAAEDSAQKTMLVQYTRPYPGPGAAAYILSRVQGQGRTLDLTAAVDYSATPGMEASATLPGTTDQTGYASSVSWDFSADTMTVGTRGLIDTPPSAWVQLPENETWLDSPVGASWISEVV